MTRREIIVEAPELRIEADRLVEPFSWEELFGRSGPVEFEVGIGKGRFLLAAAESRPDVMHLGVEWANKYLRIAEARATKRGLDNIRFARIDVNEMMDSIPDASVSAYYVFYPDPWPKKRHLKRRFLQQAGADQMARTLVPGGLFHAATDHTGYWEAVEPLFVRRAPGLRATPELRRRRLPGVARRAADQLRGQVRGRGSSRSQGKLAPGLETPTGGQSVEFSRARR